MTASSQSFKNPSRGYEPLAGLLQVQCNSHEKGSFDHAPPGFTLGGQMLLQIAVRLSSPLRLQSTPPITGDKSFGVKPLSCSRM